MAGKWMQGVRKSMEKRGTVGAFGKATPAKIARAKREGGVEEKRAVLAQTFKRIARNRKRR